jgi:hypothetical protein
MDEDLCSAHMKTESTRIRDNERGRSNARSPLWDDSSHTLSPRNTGCQSLRLRTHQP